MNVIQGECTKCKNITSLNSFIHIISIADEEHIKHLISDSDFCPQCNSYFSVKVSFLEQKNKMSIKDSLINLKKINLIDEEEAKTTLIDQFLKK